MKIELKKVSYNKKFSRETSAYTADIWVDGSKRGTVMNDGGGGTDHVEPAQLSRDIETYANSLPQVEAFGMKLTQSTDMVLGDLLNKYLAAKELQKQMKTKTLFTKTDGKVYSIKGLIAVKDAVRVLN